ncbi:MAG: efflux RND transporter periplasmic adaptor subunit [Verrucomicrobiota bacterium]|nr:efflux RND transporter periplasmic adaptor subunit [Verrucomicrobiota bacterium]
MEIPKFNPAIREVKSTRPRLRSNLKFSFQDYRGHRYAVTEDPISSKFYRIGLAEYYFITQFDGNTSFGEAYARASRSCGSEALSEQEAINVMSWLSETGLADFGAETLAIPGGKDQSFDSKKILGLLGKVSSILFYKLPLGSPDRFFTRIAPYMRWAFGIVGWAVWFGVVLLGLFTILWNRDQFELGTAGLLAHYGWVWMAVTWFGLKLVHEFWHGMVCKHYGGKAREAGLVFILFAPIGFVDVTSSWGFPEKWKRIHVAAGGMLAELFVAGIAAVIWGLLEPGAAKLAMYNVIIMGTIVTWFFNANPLMKFDGYYILSDLLEMPNLYNNSLGLIVRLFKKYMLGVRQIESPDWRQRETWIYAVYGLLAGIWKFVVFAGLLMAMSILFKGGGVAIALAVLAAWIASNAASSYDYLRYGRNMEFPDPKVYTVRLGVAALVVVLILFIPIAPTLNAPAIVEIHEQKILRVECPGFVRKVLVHNGEQVADGQLLVEMENEDEQIKTRQLEMRLSRQEVKSRMALSEQDAAGHQYEEAALRALQTQVEEKKGYIESLTVHAPLDGVAMGRNLEQLEGRFLRVGEEIVRVGPLPANEVTIVFPQGQVDYFRAQKDFPIDIKIQGRPGVYDGVVRIVSERASKDIPHAALTALGNGPLSVVPIKTNEKSGQGENSENQFELISPVFTAKATIKPPDDAIELFAGEKAYVRFKSRLSKPIWKLTHQKFAEVINHLLQQAEDAANQPS